MRDPLVHRRHRRQGPGSLHTRRGQQRGPAAHIRGAGSAAGPRALRLAVHRHRRSQARRRRRGLSLSLQGLVRAATEGPLHCPASGRGSGLAAAGHCGGTLMHCPTPAPTGRARISILLLAATLCCAAALLPAGAGAAPSAPRPAANHWAALPAPTIARAAAIKRPTWLSGVLVTEYWPVPERWFVGRRVRPAGLTSEHRLDWLYSARGVTMQGTGIGLNGRYYHVNALGRGGWVDRLGRAAAIGGAREVFWRAGAFWRNPLGLLTFPLEKRSEERRVGKECRFWWVAEP